MTRRKNGACMERINHQSYAIVFVVSNFLHRDYTAEREAEYALYKNTVMTGQVRYTFQTVACKICLDFGTCNDLT